MDKFLHTFSDFEHISLPERFTYPFHYTPHPLCVKAAEAVQAYIQRRGEWHSELQQGKMFGVLVVRTPEGETGFLAAFSGNLAGSNHHDYFVPPVYDLLNPDGYFKEEEARISALNAIIDRLSSSGIQNSSSGIQNSPSGILSSPSVILSSPSVILSEAKNLNTSTSASQILHSVQDDNKSVPDYINCLKEERKNRSIALQQWIFRQFILHNALGETKDIQQIFEETARRNPPAGTGECAAPKLLQHAYINHLQPLAMAEFWWGNSPKGEIRRHGHYYPSCRHKCEPILGFMLQGLDVEPNPLLTSITDPNLMETVYEDEYLLVVNKPSGMLSVPGKTGQASVLSILQERYPDATGPLLVHRLDMDTSGLLLAAKDKATHALLQEQFESRHVKKRYIALLEGVPQGKEPKGFIRLPLRPDYDNRPLQVVCFEYGKPAVTRYEVLDVIQTSPSVILTTTPPSVILNEVKDLNTYTDASQILRFAQNDKREALNDKPAKTRIALYPETGRTHQLRVHCAHPDGLDSPIMGDPLYGQPSDRLYLHAEALEFRHPVTGQRMHITKEAPF